MLLLWTCLFVCFTTDVFGSVLRNQPRPTAPPTPPVKQCEMNGTYYEPGSSFSPSPCEFCQCSSDGKAMCAIVDCVPAPCVDSVHDPTKCCTVCPNGPNCKYNGHVILEGKVYTEKNGTFCKCPVVADSFRSGPAQVLCYTRDGSYISSIN